MRSGSKKPPSRCRRRSCGQGVSFSVANRAAPPATSSSCPPDPPLLRPVRTMRRGQDRGQVHDLSEAFPPDYDRLSDRRIVAWRTRTQHEVRMRQMDQETRRRLLLSCPLFDALPRRRWTIFCPRLDRSVRRGKLFQKGDEALYMVALLQRPNPDQRHLFGRARGHAQYDRRRRSLRGDRAA